MFVVCIHTFKNLGKQFFLLTEVFCFVKFMKSKWQQKKKNKNIVCIYYYDTTCE